MMLVLVMMAQAASAQVPPPTPQANANAPKRFSILAGPAPPCPESRDEKGDIVVCAANNSQQQRLPLPDEAPPEGPTPSNPYRTGSGALAAVGTPCPISRSCIVGFGPPVVPMVKGAVDLARKAFGRKPDKTGRVSIDPDDEPISTTGRILP